MNSPHPRKILSLSLHYPQENSFSSSQEDTIYGCVNPPLEKVESGQAIPLPSGTFAIQSILERLPSNWHPDLISMSSSLSLDANPPIPQGVSTLDCPTVMKLTDSHHMSRPLQRLIEYCQQVACRYTWTTYDRHHLHFFKEAGLNNCFWMPGAISLFPYSVQSEPVKQYEFLFCGSLNQSHPYRTQLLEFLQQKGIQVTIKRFSYIEALKAYCQAKIVFNCSLNGDFNRRIFEVLMAGGFLLTDRLSSESGLPLLFQEKTHLDCYESPGELLERVQYYLDHPDEAEAIAKGGKEELWEHYNPELLRERFYNFVTGKEDIPDLFLAKNDDRIFDIPDTTQKLRCRLEIYEFIQEIHRLNPAIRIVFWQVQNSKLLKDLQDLPKLIFLESREENLSNAQIIITERGTDFINFQESLNSLHSSLPVNGLLCILRHGETTQITLSLTKQGYKLVNENSGYSLYQRISGNQDHRITLNLPEQPQQLPVLTRVLRKLKRLISSTGKGH